MKTIALSMLGLIFVNFSFGASGQADIYERPGTSGEYPTAYKTIQPVILHVRQAPSDLFSKNEKCTLKAAKDLGSAKLQKTIQVGIFKVLDGITISVFDDSNNNAQDLVLQKGEVVEELSYLAEGNCKIRWKEKIYEASCPSALADKNFEQLRELKQQSWHYLSCENTNGWLLEEELKLLSGVQERG